MTALASNQIPATALGTLEKLLAWALLAQSNTAPNEQVNIRYPDGQVITEPYISVSVIRDNNGVYRLSANVNIKLDTAYVTATTPVWASALEATTVALGTGYTA